MAQCSVETCDESPAAPGLGSGCDGSSTARDRHASRWRRHDSRSPSQASSPGAGMQSEQHAAQARDSAAARGGRCGVLEALDRQALQRAQVVGHLRLAPAPMAGQVRQHRAVTFESADSAPWRVVEHLGQAQSMPCRIGNGDGHAAVVDPPGRSSARRLVPTGRAASARAGARRRPAVCRGARAAAARGCRAWRGRRTRPGAAGGCRAGGCLRRPSAEARRAAPCPSSTGACARKVGRPGLGSVAWWPWIDRLVRCIRSTAIARYCAISSGDRRRRATAPRLCSSGTMARPLGDFWNAWWLRPAARARPRRTARHRRPDLQEGQQRLDAPAQLAEHARVVRGTRRARRR